MLSRDICIRQALDRISPIYQINACGIKANERTFSTGQEPAFIQHGLNKRQIQLSLLFTFKFEACSRCIKWS